MLEPWCLAALITANLLLSGIADIDLTKLQRVQNRLARVVTIATISSQCSIAVFPSLVTVKFRIHSKICLLTFKILHTKNHLYICRPCSPHYSHTIQSHLTRKSPYQLPGSGPTQPLRPSPVEQPPLLQLPGNV